MNKQEYKQSINIERLDVYDKVDPNVICCLVGIDTISTYCQNNDEIDENQLEFLNYSYENVSTLAEYDIEFSMYELKTSENEKKEMSEKHYKLIKEISYVSPENIKFVVKMIKETEQGFSTMKRSKVSCKRYTYQFQIISENEIDRRNILEMITAISQVKEPLTKLEQGNVIADYKKLITPLIEPKFRDEETILLMPKPITLERTNLLSPEEYGVVSIKENYAVTEKADGERYLLYIDNSGVAYFINNTKNVSKVGITVESLKNSLLDGELIFSSSRKDHIDKDVFALFDIYMLKGQSTIKCPLISDKKNPDTPNRYDYMQELNSHMTANNNKRIDIIVKKQLYPTDENTIFDSCSSIISRQNEYPYHIDGLIFTPKYLPVLSYYSHKPLSLSKNMKWDRVFKWKPPEENTIDFIIKYVGDKSDLDGTYGEYDLYVGYNVDDWEQISIIGGLSKFNKFDGNRQTQNYTLKTFLENHNKVWLPYNSSGVITTQETNQVILNNSVVEFSYKVEEGISPMKRWIAKRLREDKSRIYKYGDKSGKISKSANDFKVALNVWQSIHNPITQLMITNYQVIEKQLNEFNYSAFLSSEDTYYNRSMHRSNLLSVDMMNFHNICIKNMLYRKVSKNGAYLMELGCGEGGDLPRWIQNKYKCILGIDYVKKNITNPRSGAYSRALSQFKKLKRTPTTIFAVGDCRKNLKSGEGSKDIDTESEELLKYLLNPKVSINQKIYKQLQELNIRKINGFDVCSCMFTLHYFFINEQSLNNFLSNVSENLKNKGKFIATFMDGDEVYNKLRKTTKIEGRKKNLVEGDLPMWAIIKRYDDNDTSKYGKTIDVFIENTGKLIPEYLVSFQHLVSEAKKHNLTLVKSEMFKETYDNLKSDNEDKGINTIITNFGKDNILKDFSFLNRWVIFEKSD
jgi:mRNA (guanine-N7-)-methyltransferase